MLDYLSPDLPFEICTLLKPCVSPQWRRTARYTSHWTVLHPNRTKRRYVISHRLHAGTNVISFSDVFLESVDTRFYLDL